RRAAAMAAAFLLLAAGVWGSQRSVRSTVTLDVNPGIEIRMNQRERVVDVIPLNDDARTVTADMDFSGSSLEVTVNALIGSMLRHGYLSADANSILISVDGKNSAELQQRLSAEVEAIFADSELSAAVLTQTVDHSADALARSHGISSGKAQLIEKVVAQNSLHSFEELAGLSINELNLLLGEDSAIISTGSASTTAYVGEEAALATALQHAGLDGVERHQCELDWENGRMVYELEFRHDGREYDYEIDAASGEILKAGQEGRGTDAAITGSEADAKAAALQHAGLSEADIRDFDWELEQKGGRRVYELDFESGAYEYEYLIDAESFEVLRHHKERD
ncbi:MAG: PepSY domain-containing protein, partial [Oscillospiraceae bacterium]|nr:PepSY domain-containing protein [Oscillospiraceae bacterium]